MSPSKLKRAEIKASDGRNVLVDRTDADTVLVTWACGAHRTFTPAGLRAAVDNFELITAYSDGGIVWMEDADHQGRKFACHLADGRFHADDSVSAQQYHVPWATFKKALLARAKDAPTRPEQA